MRFDLNCNCLVDDWQEDMPSDPRDVVDWYTGRQREELQNYVEYLKKNTPEAIKRKYRDLGVHNIDEVLESYREWRKSIGSPPIYPASGGIPFFRGVSIADLERLDKMENDPKTRKHFYSMQSAAGGLYIKRLTREEAMTIPDFTLYDGVGYATATAASAAFSLQEGEPLPIKEAMYALRLLQDEVKE